MNAVEILKKYFGYDSFRKGQEAIIQSILSERDALAVMPTGAGKSICYQVPALLLPGITLVISPLISLMQDQVKSLNEAGIHAAFINSSLTETQISKALDLALRGTYKIIYVAPERLESAGFLQFAAQAEISMVTVDEAHCISQWGQDFRPSYLKIVDFIGRLPKRPIVSAFTATATEEVKTDIECILKLEHPSVVVTGFDRENLYYRVEDTSAKFKDGFVLDYIAGHPNESGIVYCATRKNVDALYETLFKQGIPVARYHAGMDNRTRKLSQDDFIYDRAQVIVATNAFGMGIDKSNVRFVIHYNMPQSMENYYQEAGRAGRDGENAQCILLFSAQDVVINKFLLNQKEFEDVDNGDMELIKQRDAYRLQIMEGYCRTTSCLRNYILEYFGEKTNTPCDNCGNCHRGYSEVDMTMDAKWVINCIAETKGRYGQNIVIGTLLGANRARLKEMGAAAYKSYGMLSHRTEKELRLLISQMLSEGYLFRTEGAYSVLQMGDISRLKEESTRVMIKKFEEKEEPAVSRKQRKRSTDSLTSMGFRLFEKLRQLRFAIAKEEAVPPYIVFNDKTLIDMCVRSPKDKQEMLMVSGVGENKFYKYGQRFLDEIAEFLAEHSDAVLSVGAEEDVLDGFSEKGKKPKGRKGEFYLNPGDAEKFEYSEYDYISDIKERLNNICSAENVKKVTVAAIWDYLVFAGLAVEEERDGRFMKAPTESGLAMDIKTVDKVRQSGFEYQLLMYPKAVQKMIVEHFAGLRDEDNSGDDGAMLRNQRSNHGLPWTDEEDERLVGEFQSGLKMAEIAKIHGRTNGSIQARLEKHGLIE
ncbi:MAG: DNA helicase RecQ [Ruminococcus sp.]|nr:DNA helicase RecQ [Ruminococcus sp.]